MNDQSRTKAQATTAHSQVADGLFILPDAGGSSGIEQRLRLDMDRLFRKGHMRVISREEGPMSRSIELDGDAQPTTHTRAGRILNQGIADCLDLQSQCRQARWALMDSAYLEHRSICTQAIQLVEHYVSLLGNRIVALGGVVDSTVRQVAARSGLNEYPAEAETPQTHIDSVAFAFWLVSGAMRGDCSELAELGDTTSRDLLDQTAASLARCLILLEVLGQETASA